MKHLFISLLTLFVIISANIFAQETEEGEEHLQSNKENATYSRGVQAARD
ncbi:MAG: hypothetical protein IPG02_11915 [Ignavibacteria bacterium]|nr:hypothetical protein [Ignavibacteria bacterium]